MQSELYALGDVAKLLAVKPHRILYLLSVEPSLEPRLRVAGKRLWTMPEIAPLAERMSIQITLKGAGDE